MSFRSNPYSEKLSRNKKKPSVNDELNLQAKLQENGRALKKSNIGVKYYDTYMLRVRKKKPKAKLEKSIEKSAVDEMREDGAMVAKLNLMGQKSWPDRLIFPPGAKIRIFTCWTKEQAVCVYQLMKKKYPRDPFMIEFKRDADHPLSDLQRELQRTIGEYKP